MRRVHSTSANSAGPEKGPSDGGNSSLQPGLAQEVHNAVTPHGHNVPGVKLKLLLGVVVSSAACCGGEVNVRMPLLVTAPDVDDAEASRQQACAKISFQNNVCREATHFGEQPAVVVYQRPELTGNREGDALPFPVRH